MFMTSLTTALGFLSNTVSSIPVILSFSSTMSILVIVRQDTVDHLVQSTILAIVQRQLTTCRK
jgi:predicted RND superfamily exporter protein